MLLVDKPKKKREENLCYFVSETSLKFFLILPYLHCEFERKAIWWKQGGSVVNPTLQEGIGKPFMYWLDSQYGQ